MWSNMI